MSPPSVRNGKRPAQTQLDPETYRKLKMEAARRDLTLPRLIEEILAEYANHALTPSFQVLEQPATGQ